MESESETQRKVSRLDSAPHLLHSRLGMRRFNSETIDTVANLQRENNELRDKVREYVETSAGKYFILIGWITLILASDWLKHTTTSLWLIDISNQASDWLKQLVLASDWFRQHNTSVSLFRKQGSHGRTGEQGEESRVEAGGGEDWLGSRERCSHQRETRQQRQDWESQVQTETSETGK